MTLLTGFGSEEIFVDALLGTFRARFPGEREAALQRRGQGRSLKLEQIWTELRTLVAVKEEPEILVKLQTIFDRHLD